MAELVVQLLQSDRILIEIADILFWVAEQRGCQD